MVRFRYEVRDGQVQAWLEMVKFRCCYIQLSLGKVRYGQSEGYYIWLDSIIIYRYYSIYIYIQYIKQYSTPPFHCSYITCVSSTLCFQDFVSCNSTNDQALININAMPIQRVKLNLYTYVHLQYFDVHVENMVCSLHGVVQHSNRPTRHGPGLQRPTSQFTFISYGRNIIKLNYI